MRKATNQEAAEWSRLAEEHGALHPDGSMKWGRITVESGEGGARRVRFVTPMPAADFSDDLAPKTPPIRFDRTSAGQIIVPGRWWQRGFERMSEREDLSEEKRARYRRWAREAHVSDVLLPTDTDTIELLVPGPGGQGLVSHEALPPNTVITLVVHSST